MSFKIKLYDWIKVFDFFNQVETGEKRDTGEFVNKALNSLYL